MKIITKFKQKNRPNKGNIILEVDVDLSKKISEYGHLNIGWRRCLANEYYNIARCFKCGRYGHTQSTCQNSITCYICAKAHYSKECNNTLEKKCINCLETNKKLGKTLKTDHCLTDPECPCFKRIAELEIKKPRRRSNQRKIKNPLTMKKKMCFSVCF
ncbi:unnamed protein product, partial [Psylliodes chrysocephalus]